MQMQRQLAAQKRRERQMLSGMIVQNDAVKMPPPNMANMRPRPPSAHQAAPPTATYQQQQQPPRASGNMAGAGRGGAGRWLIPRYSHFFPHLFVCNAVE